MLIRRAYVDDSDIQRQTPGGNRLGMPDRNSGVKSAKPSFTAWRTLRLTNRLLMRTCSAMSGVT